MITLTNPPTVTAKLGSSAAQDKVSYDKFALCPIVFDPIGLTIRGTVRLLSTANPDMNPITGSFEVNASTGKLVIEVAQVDFLRRITLTPGQITGVRNTINDTQNAIENHLINVGVVGGAQSTGI